MNVSVFGLGFVGKAMFEVFLEKEINVKGYDINEDLTKNSFEEAIDSEIIFLALPTPYDSKKKSYLLDSLIETLKKLDEKNFKGLIVVKSTLIPGSINFLENKYPHLIIIHNPEFLTARTAKEDFKNQKHIVLGRGRNCSNENFENLIQFYKNNFPNSEISCCTASESESMKIFLNSFYALKVQFFTEIYLTCKKINIDYENILPLMLKNGWINPMHTKVPGPDKNISYGGYCFPKDTNALNEFMKQNKVPNMLLDACIKERNKMREDNLNILKNTRN